MCELKKARRASATNVNFFVLQMFQRIQQQAGFIEFLCGNFSKASELFHKSKLDVREVSNGQMTSSIVNSE